MKKVSKLVFLACLITIASGAWETAHAQANFYDGKTIRMIVGFTAGGGYDAYTRTISRHMGKHIPGHPVMIVVLILTASPVERPPPAECTLRRPERRLRKSTSFVSSRRTQQNSLRFFAPSRLRGESGAGYAAFTAKMQRREESPRYCGSFVAVLR